MTKQGNCLIGDNRPILAKGLCKLHYRRWRANVKRFERYYIRSYSCSIWQGQNYSDGRPCLIWRDITTRKKVKMHALRAAMLISEGPLFTTPLEAAHTCHNAWCVNRRHGFWATHSGKLLRMGAR